MQQRRALPPLMFLFPTSLTILEMKPRLCVGYCHQKIINLCQNQSVQKGGCFGVSIVHHATYRRVNVV